MQTVDDDIGRASIEPAIDAALAAFPGTAAGHAAGVIRRLLASRLAAGPDRWGRSKLTGDGFPFELAFSSADQRLRFTLEPGPADLDPERRLDVAAHLIREEGGGPIPAEVLDGFRAMQRGACLGYGAWIGCRVGPEGPLFKLYAEVPADRRLPDYCAPGFTLPDRPVVPRMVAYTPAKGICESYVRVPSFEPIHLRTVFDFSGFLTDAARMVDLIEDAYGYAIRGRLPGPSVGVSHVFGVPGVTLHFYARSLWGSDARIRRGVARVAGARGWEPERYLKITEPVADRESWKTYHGLFGITVNGAGISFTVGVRPVCA